jgi:hypothetical protein
MAPCQCRCCQRWREWIKEFQPIWDDVFPPAVRQPAPVNPQWRDGIVSDLSWIPESYAGKWVLVRLPEILDSADAPKWSRNIGDPPEDAAIIMTQVGARQPAPAVDVEALVKSVVESISMPPVGARAASWRRLDLLTARHSADRAIRTYFAAQRPEPTEGG